MIDEHSHRHDTPAAARKITQSIEVDHETMYVLDCIGAGLKVKSPYSMSAAATASQPVITCQRDDGKKVVPIASLCHSAKARVGQSESPGSDKHQRQT
jgi:hypothetical protein